MINETLFPVKEIPAQLGADIITKTDINAKADY